MAYNHYTFGKPDPADALSPSALLVQLQHNLDALMDGLVFSGSSPEPVNWAAQNSDGTPATDPSMPYQYVGVLAADGNHRWKIINTYDGGGNLTVAEHHRSYNAGAAWVLIKTTTMTYSGGEWVSTTES